MDEKIIEVRAKLNHLNSRASYFLDRAEKATGPFDVEGDLYAVARMAENFAKFVETAYKEKYRENTAGIGSHP